MSLKQGLKKVDRQHEIQTLIKVFRDYRKGLCDYAIKRLAAIGADAIPALIHTFQYDDDHTPKFAAVTLRKMGAQAIPALLKARHHRERRIAWGAAWVLASIPEAREFVLAAAPVELAQPAAEALQSLPKPIADPPDAALVPEAIPATELAENFAATECVLVPQPGSAAAFALTPQAIKPAPRKAKSVRFKSLKKGKTSAPQSAQPTQVRVAG